MYDPKPIYPRPSSPVFERSIGRTEKFDKNPGTGSYNPNKEATMYTSPKWTIGEKRS